MARRNARHFFIANRAIKRCATSFLAIYEESKALLRCYVAFVAV